MKKTRIQNIILAALGIGICTSCSIDDLSPSNPNESVFASAESLVIGTYDAYQKIPANEYLITELRSDNMDSDSGDGDLGNIQSYRITADMGEAADYWTNNYSVILNANKVLQLVSDGEEVADQFIGEAYFMRALSHFNLVRNFLNIPYVDEVMDETTEVTNLDFAQQTPEETYEDIIADFLLAKEYLGTYSEKNRANAGAASAFLAKAYMSQPVPDYALAKAELDLLVVDDNTYGYALEESYTDIIQSGNSNELNNEILFAITYDGSTAVTSGVRFEDQVEGDAQGFSYAMSKNGRAGGMVYTDDLLNHFLDPTVEPVRGSNPLGTSPVYRYEATEGKYFGNKYYDGTDDTSEIDFVVLRYADVLLLHAEAIMAGAEFTDDLDAIASYNMVRNRAGVEELATDGTAILSKEDLLLERRLELSFENHRIYDLNRFGMTTSVLTEFSNNYGYNFESHHAYLPIPQREIDLTQGFYVQNDGY